MGQLLRNVCEDFKKHPRETAAGLGAALKEGAIRVGDFSVRECFAACYGHHTLPGTLEEFQRTPMASFREAAGAVSSDAFLNITQQFAQQAVMEAYDLPELVVKARIPSRQSNKKFERVPGITNLGDQFGGVVGEGKDFPEFGVSEDWTDTPETVKRGGIVPLTKEAIFFDETGVLVQRCQQAGEWLGVNDEVRAIDCVIDAGEGSGSQYRYRWRGDVYATYGPAAGKRTWDNLATANDLVDYTSVETAWKKLIGIVDPFTGQPQLMTAKDILFAPDRAFRVPFVLGGTLKRATPGFAATGNPSTSEVQNPVPAIVGSLAPVTSQLLAARMAAAGMASGTWFMGDLAAAFEEIVNWPLQVLQLASGSLDEFKRDIVTQFRVDKRSTFSTRQPRKMMKNTP